MSENMALGANIQHRQYHIDLTPEQVGAYAILPGDPGRVEEIAQYLENPVFVAEKREYRTFAGALAGQKVIVMSTGIGGPSAAIGIEELIKCGVHTFIRIGTCGGMQPEVLPGDLVIAQAVIRSEGTSYEYLPQGYPACADITITNALRQSAEDAGLRHHTGVVHSKDNFYGQTEPDTMPIGDILKSKWDAYIKAGCLASEMEAAALYTVGLVRRVRVGCVLTAIWNPELHKAGVAQTQYLSNERAIKCAVNATKMLINQASF
ncbi:MAG: uridine phosphorylase [Oscillospiraceae bacterium]|nr:uridine phosphorylase [Oscillospiraceae bacterium]